MVVEGCGGEREGEYYFFSFGNLIGIFVSYIFEIYVLFRRTIDFNEVLIFYIINFGRLLKYRSFVG